MNLIDTNGIAYIFERSLNIQQKYFMAPEVLEEAEMTEIHYGKKIPDKVSSIYECDFFDECLYLDFYKRMLNTHSGKSFFNMTGFGDVSILASVHTVISLYSKKKQVDLFDPTEEIIVFTNDRGLKKRIFKEFVNKEVEVSELKNLS